MNQKQVNYDLTETILGCCFDVMNELGSGFLESVYKNALCIALREKGLQVETEKRFEVLYKGQRVGMYCADIVVEATVILELKSCDSLLNEHQAQLINYLTASGMNIGLLVNFGNRKIEFKRVYKPYQSAVKLVAAQNI